MKRKDEEKNLVYFIPKNFEEKSVTMSGISYRNVIETVILLGIIVAILWFSPIDTVKTKIIIGIVLGVPVGAISLFGINKCSLSEYFINLFRFKLSPKIYVKKSLFKK